MCKGMCPHPRASLEESVLRSQVGKTPGERRQRGEDSRVTLFYPTMCGAVVMDPLVPSLLESVSISWTHVGVIGAMGGWAPQLIFYSFVRINLHRRRR
jgi:hypothetical protein